MSVTLGTLLITGCATQQYSYIPVGEKNIDVCLEEKSICLIETENGEALLSMLEKSAVTLNFVEEGFLVEKETEKTFFDFLMTVTNLNDTALDFDPKSIPGYDEESLVKDLKDSNNTAMMLAVGLLAFAAVTEDQAMLQRMSDPMMWQPIMDQTNLNNEKISLAEKEYANEKIGVQSILKDEIAAGRIILKGEAISSYSSDTAQSVLEVVIPVGEEKHTFIFIKQSHENESL